MWLRLLSFAHIHSELLYDDELVMSNNYLFVCQSPERVRTQNVVSIKLSRLGSRSLLKANRKVQLRMTLNNLVRQLCKLGSRQYYDY